MRDWATREESTEHKTGELFGDLWHRYEDDLFEESVRLFGTRFQANGFDLDWFRGSTCLDAGCGGGRYAVAMARLGARFVVGCDISFSGLRDAVRRGTHIDSLSFEAGSVLSLPHPDGCFHFVCCSGVLHHTVDPEVGLRELTRVLRPGGMLYLLLYGTGGLRWPTITKIRPDAQAMGYEILDEATRRIGLPANKQRTFLDDLFVPIIRFYEWEQVIAMLKRNGLTGIQRWERGKLDHEESVEAQRRELVQLRRVFEELLNMDGNSSEALRGFENITLTLDRIDAVEEEFQAGRMDESQRKSQVFGSGHHRVLAMRE